MSSGIVVAGFTLLVNVATVAKEGCRIVAMCPTTLRVVATHSRNGLSQAAMLTDGVIRSFTAQASQEKEFVSFFRGPNTDFRIYTSVTANIN